MTYLLVSLPFLALALVVAIVAARRLHGTALFLAAAGLVVLTAVFDNLMIAMGLFHYEHAHLLGVLVGRAPLEDFAYPLAGALLLPAVWELALGIRGSRAAAREGRRS